MFASGYYRVQLAVKLQSEPMGTASPSGRTAVTHSGAPSGLRTVSVKLPSLRSQRMNRSPYGVGTDPSAKDSPSGGQG